MKTLVLLLACLAAANALSYVRPPCEYRTWSIHRFCVYPTQYFKFQVHYCGAWYTPKYYSSIMKVYPSTNCQEVSEDAFKKDCEEKLKTRADAILQEIRYHYYSWRSIVYSQVAAAKKKYEDEITAYTNAFLRYVWSYTARQDYIRRKDEAIATYNAAVDKMARDSINNYASALLQRYYSVLDFHKKIVENAVKCYKTRLTKISEYSSQLYQRMVQYVNSFKSSMAKIIEKKASAYRSLLFKVHCSNYWQLSNINKVVSMYRSSEFSKCYSDANAYWRKLLSVRTQLVNYYRCAYKCVTYTGGINFYRKDYHTYCQKLGAWWSCKIERTIPCFRYVEYKYFWKKTEYKDLKTCDLNAVNQSLDSFKSSMAAKGAAAVSAARSVFAAWKSKWVGIHVDYYNRYVKIVNDRHAWLVFYMRAQYYCRYYTLCGWHYAQLQAYERDLQKRRDEEIRKYQQLLFQRIMNACATFNKQVASYQTMVNDMVAKVVASYETCLNTRTAKIAEYKKKVDQMRATLRSKLMASWYKVYSSKCNQYYKMMMFYHPGQKLCGAPYSLWSSYKGKIYYEYCNYYWNFDRHWSALMPKLVNHYACSYKCNAGAKFAVPELRCSFYNWKVCYPVSNCYHYQYSLYYRYRYYRLVKCNDGRYVYIA